MRTSLLCACGGVRRLPGAVALACVAAALGCTSDYVSVAEPSAGSDVFAAAVLNHHAIALATTAPWNTIQLTVTPINPQGEAIAGLPSPTFSLSDTGSVTITPDGLLTGVVPATGVMVIATLRAGNVMHMDTAYVTITDTPVPPVLTTFALDVPPGDSTKTAVVDMFGAPGVKQVVPAATDAGGVPIDGLPVFYTTSDHTVATVDPVTGVVTAIRTGTVKIRAVTTAYGVTMHDSLELTITPPLLAIVSAVSRTPVNSTTPVLAFDPGTLTVGVGASVFFINSSVDQAIDVVFDDPTSAAESPVFPTGSGNIVPFTADPVFGPMAAARAFFVPGTYHYHSTLYDTQGTIIVQ